MKIPVATYRLQFNPGFGFQKAREIVPYLSELGISDIYASPIFKAKKESPHGYDVVDLNLLNSDLGTDENFEELIAELKNSGMGWIQDIVPNHMAFDGENQMLVDVLENGRYSKYFDFFDIEWNHPYESLRERLLAPFLGKNYSEALNEKEITLQYDKNGFCIQYYTLDLPLKLESYASVITHRLPALKKRLGAEHTDFIKFLGILYSLKNLPFSQEERSERYNQIQFIKRILWELYTKNDEIHEFINENLDIFNGRKEEQQNLNLLDSLLSEQLFRLSFWKVATEEINYRRFFNINSLISMKIENRHVFDATHSLILRLVKHGSFTGLRIDHIDGLYDPTGYLKRLREKTGDLYLVVEKILAQREELFSFWPVQGTTGYDFLNYLTGIFCNEQNGRKFNKIYYKFTGFKTSYEAILYEKKKLVIEKDMTGDIDNLAHLLKKISSKIRFGSDITLHGLKRAIVEIMAFFPVYRTYISKDVYREADRNCVTETVKRAREINPRLLHELNFIERFLMLKFSEYLSEEGKNEWVHFVMKLQQFTGPLMAKGFEDTTLYVYNRLLSLNEVGGNPDKFGVSLDEFHDFNTKKANTWPHSMNTTSTHDTKRGEDVRARINVLSEMPDLWEANLKKWSRFNRGKKMMIRGIAMPNRNDEYFLYQTLIGTLPFKKEEYEKFQARLKEYVIKAVREAKVHTAWLKPDIDYEEAFLSFIDKILCPSPDNQFLNSFIPFQKRVAYCGIFNSLSQTLIRITSPGVPDFYQGTELWDLNFVDPDNRRPVDFEKRKQFLQEIKTKENDDALRIINELFSTKEDGRIKLFLIYKALLARQTYGDLFEKGVYIPIRAEGNFKDNIIVFAREYKQYWAITVTPRFLTSVIREDEYPLDEEVWGETFISLPEKSPSRWKNVITGKAIQREKFLILGDVLKDFPVALLISEEQ